MNIKNIILFILYYPALIIDLIKSFLGIKNNKLRVLLFHFIPQEETKRFQENLIWLQKYWKIVDPNTFDKMINGNQEILGNNLFLTFDDGYLSDYYITKDVLNPMGIKALFFIIPNFIKIKEQKEREDFVFNNIFPKSNESDLSHNKNKLLNMTDKEINYLIASGQKIGFHTTSHQKLSSITDDEILIDEIVSGAELLENKFGISIDHFSFSFGNLESFNKKALKVAETKFKFIFTGMRGNNAKIKNPLAICRDSIFTNYSNQLIGSFLFGLADFIYNKKLKVYKSWID